MQHTSPWPWVGLRESSHVEWESEDRYACVRGEECGYPTRTRADLDRYASAHTDGRARVASTQRL